MQLSEKTKSVLEALGVGVVYFFGSRAQGTALDMSDSDIGVVFEDARAAHAPDMFGKIYDALAEDVPGRVEGPKLDVSFLQTANAALQMSAIRDGAVLFESSATFRADYEESIIKKFDDYRHLIRDFEEATLYALA